MKVTNKRINTLLPADDNPRLHPEASIAAIMDSLKTFGFRQPIVIRGREVVAGHGRLEAAQRLGMKTVPTVDASDLTEEQARAYRLADNRTAELSAFDPALLLQDLNAITPELAIGWDEDALRAALDAEASVPEPDPPAGPATTPLRPSPDGAITPPFTWYGSKRRAAGEIIARLGETDTYIEPFAGSLAVLLAKPPAKREIVGDTDGGIANFWRAVRADPDEVARWADNPSVHHDLAARHRWLIQWKRDNAERLMDDPDYYSAQAAGWWVWGLALWIGGGWCADAAQNWEQRPHFPDGSKGRGVSAQASAPYDCRPHVDWKASGTGVAVQAAPDDRRPGIEHLPGGSGVNAQRETLPADGSFDGVRLRSWFRALAQRLAKVSTINRPWQSLVTPVVLGLTESGEGRGNTTAVFMDPPYMKTQRTDNVLYESDGEGGASDRAAVESFEWAVANGERVRVAYCCHAGDFEPPPGWTQIATTFHGIIDQERRGQRDVVMFSPACVNPDA